MSTATLEPTTVLSFPHEEPTVPEPVNMEYNTNSDDYLRGLTVEGNRNRLLEFLRSTPEDRHSAKHYYETADGNWTNMPDPGLRVCVNGAVCFLHTGLELRRGFVSDTVGPALGIESQVVDAIDAMNFNKTFAEMAEVCEGIFAAVPITHSFVPAERVPVLTRRSLP